MCPFKEQQPHLPWGFRLLPRQWVKIRVGGRKIKGKSLSGKERNVKCHKPLKAALPWLCFLSSLSNDYVYTSGDAFCHKFAFQDDPFLLWVGTRASSFYAYGRAPLRAAPPCEALLLRAPHLTPWPSLQHPVLCLASTVIC